MNRSGSQRSIGRRLSPGGIAFRVAKLLVLGLIVEGVIASFGGGWRQKSSATTHAKGRPTHQEMLGKEIEDAWQQRSRFSRRLSAAVVFGAFVGVVAFVQPNADAHTQTFLEILLAVASVSYAVIATVDGAPREHLWLARTYLNAGNTRQAELELALARLVIRPKVRWPPSAREVSAEENPIGKA